MTCSQIILEKTGILQSLNQHTLFRRRLIAILKTQKISQIPLNKDISK